MSWRMEILKADQYHQLSTWSQMALSKRRKDCAKDSNRCSQLWQRPVASTLIYRMLSALRLERPSSLYNRTRSRRFAGTDNDTQSKLLVVLLVFFFVVVTNFLDSKNGQRRDERNAP